MESKNIMENAIKTDENLELKPSSTNEEFQIFIANLFEKNGVLNDLRAYLRGHIVAFLRNVENGDTPEAEKHFTQRLQYQFQAINALIAEYLMKMRFGYSCSVFISEIPLANMVFDYTKNLFGKTFNDNIPFSSNDIFQILNYLGMQCDKEHMSILEDYQKHDEPLLMCILKNASLYRNLVCNVDEDSLNNNSHNEKNNNQLKCKHYACCKLCQNFLSLKKEKYEKKKKQMAEKGQKYSLNNPNVKNMATKMKVIEEKLIEEMFEQLKNVYEGEIELLREGNEKKVKRSLANHASLMQKYRLELEKEVEGRWATMEAEFRERKDFVAGLAATLKDAHEKLRDARQKLKKDAEDLVIRENSLKFQLQKAEETLNVKGEELQKQIMHELTLLDEQHQNLKKEKNYIVTERQELENLKKLNETNFKLMTSYNIQERDTLVKRCDAMKNELDVLKKYIVLSNESKSNQETAVKVNNNEMIHDNDDRVKVNHVVNDLKKIKKVNFTQTVSTMCQKWCQDNVIGQNRCDGTCLDTLKRLREEHEKLQEFSKQQSSHIELLSLSLRQINQPTCTTTHSVPRQKFLKEESGENILNHDMVHVSPKTTYSRKDAAYEIKDVWNRSQRTANTDGQGISLKDRSRKTLKEARDLLWKKNKESVAEGDNSSNKITREAKLRLRKLEIEAEAVERSYLKFRQRRAQENRFLLYEENSVNSPKIDIKENCKRNSQRENERSAVEDETAKKCSYEKIYQQTNLDFDKYLRKYLYDEKRNVSLMKSSKIEHKHKKYNEEDEECKGEWHSFNYLETPLMEFRKLYHSRSSTDRATNKMTHEKIYKINSDDILNENLGQHCPDTRVQDKSKESQNINAQSLVNNLNTTPQTKIDDMHIKGNVEVTNDVQSNEFKIPNITKESKNDEDGNNRVRKLDKNKYYNIVKTNHDDLYEMNKEDSIETTKISTNCIDEKNDAVEVDYMTEPYKNDSNVEIAIDLQKISNEDYVEIASKDFDENDLATEHKNGTFDENTRDIKEINIKETSEALTEKISKENGKNIVHEDYVASDLNDPSDRKTKASELDISEKLSDIVVKDVANAGIENINGANRLTKIESFMQINPGQMTHVNNTNENEILSKCVSLNENLKINHTEKSTSVSSKENLKINNTEKSTSDSFKENLKINNTEKSTSVSSKENLKINNTDKLNQDNSTEVENHSEAEYEDDFSIPINEDSLSENDNNFPISIQKSSEEENFWD